MAMMMIHHCFRHVIQKNRGELCHGCRTYIGQVAIMDKDIQVSDRMPRYKLGGRCWCKKYGWDMQSALDQLYFQETYSFLCNPACGLCIAKGAVYVFFSYLENEMETGVAGSTSSERMFTICFQTSSVHHRLSYPLFLEANRLHSVLIDSSLRDETSRGFTKP